jgi:aromatic-L-amino-acid decarboxylase
MADSFVFNPHKWMFTNFDCSVFFVKDKEHLQNTFRLVPSYLQTQTNTEANDYSNWGIHLGRRFRALKLWFVIRNYGINGLQQRIREHLELSEYFEKQIIKSGLFELIVPRNLAVVSFRFKPHGIEDESKLNMLNAELIEKINASGRIYISHTMIRGKFTLRFVCAQTNTQKEHVEEAINTITMFANELT